MAAVAKHLDAQDVVAVSAYFQQVDAPAVPAPQPNQ
jgi:cytochrome c553